MNITSSISSFLGIQVNRGHVPHAHRPLLSSPHPLPSLLPPVVHPRCLEALVLRGLLVLWTVLAEKALDNAFLAGDRGGAGRGCGGGLCAEVDADLFRLIGAFRLLRTSGCSRGFQAWLCTINLCRVPTG